MPRPLVTWLRRSALLTVVLVVFMTILDYVVGTNSSAMAFAREVVSGSQSVAVQVGPVERVDLRLFWGYRRRSAFSGARVDLYLRVSGTKGSMPIEVNLQQGGNSWRLVSSSVPL
jgi:hypothetical protein